MIDRIQFSTGLAVGTNGAATATGYSPHVRGTIMAVYVAYLDSPPNGTDFSLSDESDPDSTAIVSLTGDGAVLDQKIYPRIGADTYDGTAITYDGSHAVPVPYVVHGRLEATIAEANSGDSVTVTVWIQT